MCVRAYVRVRVHVRVRVLGGVCVCVGGGGGGGGASIVRMMSILFLEKTIILCQPYVCYIVSAFISSEQLILLPV